MFVCLYVSGNISYYNWIELLMYAILVFDIGIMPIGEHTFYYVFHQTHGNAEESVFCLFLKYLLFVSCNIA